MKKESPLEMRVHNIPLTMDVDKVLGQLSAAEKLSLTAGNDFWTTNALSNHSIPSNRCSDGPNGVRGFRFFNSVPALCIPCGSGLGATWNKTLLHSAGLLLSAECKVKGAHTWLGPTVNMHRSPLNGRGFESFSEDPWLSGILAGAIIKGVQEGGTAAVVKHFVANDQETEKTSVDTIIGERALREIYLLPFQLAIKIGKPDAVMTSYNKVNGIHVSESKQLIKGVLRGEWGFDGLVMSDWFGTYSTEAAFAAGLDLEMPGPTAWRGKNALTSLRTGKLLQKDVDAAARSVLKFVDKTVSRKSVASEEGMRDTPEDRLLNRELARESIVLLKNEAGILPLKPDKCGDVGLIGPNIKNAAACGGGSAGLTPYYTTSAYEGIAAQLPPGANIHCEAGVYNHLLLPLLNKNTSINEDGNPGATILFFNEPHSNSDRVAFDKVSVSETVYQLMDYKHIAKGSKFFISMRGEFIPDVSGTYEFGLASYGISDLYIDGERVIVNSEEQEFGGMFFGQGSKEKRATIEMEAGKRYKYRMEAGCAASSRFAGGALSLPGGAARLGASLKLSDEEGIRRAVEVAKKCETVVLVVGLNGDYEKEGKDRSTIQLPPGTLPLINAVLDIKPNAIIVTQSGTAIDTSFRHKATTMIHTWYGGNEAGNALADVIFGKVSPSGKLPITFLDRLEDLPSFLSFGSDNGKLHYSEGIFVGYRYFDTVGRDAAFRFGHGLSYTSFSISDIQLSSSPSALSTAVPPLPTTLRVRIRNTGSMPGAEVLQLYVSPSRLPTTRFKRPTKELKGFDKVFLQPGEETEVLFELDKYSTAVWDELNEAWVCEEGMYTAIIEAGKERLEASFEVSERWWWNGL